MAEKFIDLGEYLKRAYDRNIALDEAKVGVVEALSVGRLKCRGHIKVPAVDYLKANRAENPRASKKELKARERKLFDIPSSYWDGIKVSDASLWWTNGYFDEFCDTNWVVTRINEKQANDILRRLVARSDSAPHTIISEDDKERRRRSTWDNWASALAVLCITGALKDESDEYDINTQIDLRLLRWGLTPKPTKTTARATKAVATAFRREKADRVTRESAAPLKRQES